MQNYLRPFHSNEGYEIFLKYASNIVSCALTAGTKDRFKLFVVKTHSEMKERTTFENKSHRT